MYVEMYICIKICENASEFIPKFISFYNVYRFTTKLRNNHHYLLNFIIWSINKIYRYS